VCVVTTLSQAKPAPLDSDKGVPFPFEIPRPELVHPLYIFALELQSDRLVGVTRMPGGVGGAGESPLLPDRQPTTDRQLLGVNLNR